MTSSGKQPKRTAKSASRDGHRKRRHAPQATSVSGSQHAVESQTLNVPQGRFLLAREPQIEHPTLRAWDAADSYLLDTLAAAGPDPNSQIWLFNDSCGALNCALHAYQPFSMNDSLLSQLSTRANYQRNRLSLQDCRQLDSLTLPDASSVPDWVLIKVPKSLALLEYQLLQLRPRLASHSQVIAAGMVKHLRKSFIELFERLIGPTHTSLAKKKARLIFSQREDSAGDQVENPYPSHFWLQPADLQSMNAAEVETTDTEPAAAVKIINHANVFAREKLDIGTRLFLKHLPAGRYQSVVDLGCGNGILGLLLARQQPAAEFHFVDESYMAVASAQESFHAFFPEPQHRPRAHFQVNNALAGWADASVDLIVNNPPFHQQQLVGDDVARDMFRQSHRVLSAGGELWVIGNRHLGYHKALKQLFGEVELIASNPKFVLLKAVKQG